MLDWSWKVKVAQSCLTPCDPMDSVHGILQARILEWVAFPFSSWSIQGLNPGFPRCKQILYQLSHKGSPRILEWVAYHFSSRSIWPRNRTRVSCIAGGFFTNWAISSVQFIVQSCPNLCNPMNHSTLGLPVHHQLLEFTQTHVHWVGDAIQPSHPLSSPSPLIREAQLKLGIKINSWFKIKHTSWLCLLKRPRHHDTSIAISTL